MSQMDDLLGLKAQVLREALGLPPAVRRERSRFQEVGGQVGLHCRGDQLMCLFRVVTAYPGHGDLHDRTVDKRQTFC